MKVNKLIFRTVSNFARRPPTSTMSRAAANDTDSQNGQNDEAEVVQIINEVQAGSGAGGSGAGDVKPNVRELADTAKPPMRLSKHKKEADELQTKVMSVLSEEDDDIEMAFNSIAKRIKRSLKQEERD